LACIPNGVTPTVLYYPPFWFSHISVTLPANHHLTRVEYSTPVTLTLSGSTPLQHSPEATTLLWPIEHAHFPHHDHTPCQALQTSSALAICNGSYMPCRYPHLATVAWIIHSGSLTPATCHGVTQVHGHPSLINSYQAELQGMLSLLMAINHLTTGSLLIGCNNKGVLCQVWQWISYVPSATKHADLLHAIHHAKWQCPLCLSFQYMAEHQDDFLWFDDLPLLAQLNVQADLMAKHFTSWVNKQHLPYYNHFLVYHGN